MIDPDVRNVMEAILAAIEAPQGSRLEIIAHARDLLATVNANQSLGIALPRAGESHAT